MLVAGADPAVRVPATPLWDVHDVVAHLAGICEDALSGNMAGVTTDPWTEAQVARGRGVPVGELVAAWSAGAPLVESVLSESSDPVMNRAVIDVLTHEADLAHALGVPASIPPDALAWAAGVLQADFDEAVARAGLPQVSVVASDWEWLRGRLGRRTTDEVLALDWSADPVPYLDRWFVFGRAASPLGEVPPHSPVD